MKNKIAISLLAFMFNLFIGWAQEGTKIPFNSGVLKLCSSKNFIIKGYDGKEVIIKNLNPHASFNMHKMLGLSVRSTSKNGKIIGEGTASTITSVHGPDSIRTQYFPVMLDDRERSKGLKKLGKSAAAKESGIYLHIEQKSKELIIRDDMENSFVMMNNEKYEITIPNSIKLTWLTNECGNQQINQSRFFNSETSELSNFKGEVEISSSLNNIKLTDVSGPVSINTIGGNVTIIFEKTLPNKLYSVYSNNGFIDMAISEKSSIKIDAIAQEILSDLNFDIVSETKNGESQQMELKLGTGKTYMRLEAVYSNVYLRKK